MQRHGKCLGVLLELGCEQDKRVKVALDETYRLLDDYRGLRDSNIKYAKRKPQA